MPKAEGVGVKTASFLAIAEGNRSKAIKLPSSKVNFHDMELTDTDYRVDELEVYISHPFIDFPISLQNWLENGPGPRRLVSPFRLQVRETKEELPLSIIPLQYRNDRWSRLLIKWGFLEYPWGEKQP